MPIPSAFFDYIRADLEAINSGGARPTAPNNTPSQVLSEYLAFAANLLGSGGSYPTGAMTPTELKDFLVEYTGCIQNGLTLKQPDKQPPAFAWPSWADLWERWKAWSVWSNPLPPIGLP